MKSFAKFFIFILILSACSRSIEDFKHEDILDTITPTRKIATSTPPATQTPRPILIEATPTKTIKPSSTPVPINTKTPYSPDSIPPTPIDTSRPGKIAYSKVTVSDIEYEIDQGIYISNLDGSDPVEITKGLEGESGVFEWSPDGKWLLFFMRIGPTVDDPENYAHISYYPEDVWLYPTDGSGLIHLAEITRHYDMGYPLFKWSIDGKFLLFICPTSNMDNEICIYDVEKAKLIRTGNQGKEPQFSPNNRYYSWMSKDNKYIYISSVITHNPIPFFAIGDGEIPGFSWSNDSKSIITAVSKMIGFSEIDGVPYFLCDGQTNVISVELASYEITQIMTIDQPIFGWDLSGDREILLTGMLHCVGNVYTFDGIVNLVDETIIWPIGRNFVFHEWTRDYKYLLQLDFTRRAYVDPHTGDKFDFVQPDWIEEFLSYDKGHDTIVSWEIQPLPETE